MKLREIHRMLHALSVEGYTLVRAPRQDHRQTQGDQPKSQESGDSSLRQEPLIVDMKQPPKRSANTKQKWYKSPKWWKSAFQFLVGVAGIGYAIVTYCQWRDLKNNFVIDQRAWIGIKGLTLLEKPQRGKRMNVRIEYINTGKTPALDVSMQDFRMFLVPGRAIHGDPLADTGKGVLGPNNFESFFAGGDLSDEAVEALNLRLTQVFVMGRISYRDSFGNWRNTTYCGSYPTRDIESSNFFNCPYGNGMN